MTRSQRFATAAGIVVLLAAAGVAFAALRADTPHPAAETPLPATATVAPTATIQPPPTAESPAATMVMEITRVSVPAGGSAEAAWGLLLGNALTGGAELWLMPGGTMPQGVSPSGRYFVAGDSLFDGWTGTRTKIHDDEHGLLLASFAPDDSRVLVLDAANDGRILNLDGAEVVRLPQAAPMARASASQLDIVWTADSRAVAIIRHEGDHNRVDVVFDDVVQHEIPSDGITGYGLTGWANSGHLTARGSDSFS